MITMPSCCKKPTVKTELSIIYKIKKIDKKLTEDLSKIIVPDKIKNNQELVIECLVKNNICRTQLKKIRKL